jgi:sugar fermentation stimulation protein A
MEFPELIYGRFLRRDNRFRATVLVNGQERAAHVPNSGRLADLFMPNREVWLAPADSPHRKTSFDLKLVNLNGVLVSVDARLPNHLFAEAVKAGCLPGFASDHIEAEVPYNASRLDFRLSGQAGVCWVETKSVTLVEHGTALFPDVPTSRGSRHLRELMTIQQAGENAAVLFVIQRPDAQQLTAHAAADPLFAATLLEAANLGVQARAFCCDVSYHHIVIQTEIPVIFPE